MRSYLTVICLLSLFFQLDAMAVVEAEHTDGCPACHQNDQVTLVKESGELCQSCHDMSIEPGSHHPLNIPSPQFGTITLPMEEGDISCLTCHNPHKSGAGNMGLTLPYNELCTHCHQR